MSRTKLKSIGDIRDHSYTDSSTYVSEFTKLEELKEITARYLTGICWDR